MGAPSAAARRALARFALCLVVAALFMLGLLFWQHRPGPRLMTLDQALWVTERDGSRFYPPGSPPSRNVISAIARQGFPVSEPRFDTFVLYRQGLAETDDPNEKLLIFGFVPPDR